MNTWTIQLRPISQDVPDAVKVRRLLKALLRSFGLRCIDIRQNVKPAQNRAAEAASEQETPA